MASVQTDIVIRQPLFTYLQASLLGNKALTNHVFAKAAESVEGPSVDLLTARTCITAALQQYLGMSGAAISVDLLKVAGTDVWFRVPQPDGPMVRAALSQWCSRDGQTTWRVNGVNDWLLGMVNGDGQDLFDA